VTTPSVFDLEESQHLVEARAAFLGRFVSEFGERLGLRTALDAGCGVGHFSSRLRQMGLRVTAFDARPENVEDARRRYPGIEFHVADAEELRPQEFGVFDLVLCFGLLYHLENPLRALRRLRAMTGKVLLVESVCVPGRLPQLYLRDEASLPDQALNAVACYPSEGALVKMTYRAGFPVVYRPLHLPEHEDFQGRLGRLPWRTVLVAPVAPIQDSSLLLVDEPDGRADLWSSDPTGLLNMGRKLQVFIKRPWAENWARLRRRCGPAGK
jgi:SAM-dependent methyltransferase